MNKFKTEYIQCGQPLTSKLFVKLFNDISNDYSAELQLAGDVTIADRGDWPKVAMLRLDSQSWLFEYERAYSWQELTLMTQLAATSPELRGGNNND